MDGTTLADLRLQEGKSLSSEEVLEFLKDKLHKMAIPDAVEFIDELPHTATGKINNWA